MEEQVVAVPCSPELSQQVNSLITGETSVQCLQCRKFFEAADALKKHRCSFKQFNVQTSISSKYRHLCNALEIAKLELLAERFVRKKSQMMCPVCKKTNSNDRFWRGSHLNAHIKKVPLPCRENGCKEKFFTPLLRQCHEVYGHPRMSKSNICSPSTDGKFKIIERKSAPFVQSTPSQNVTLNTEPTKLYADKGGPLINQNISRALNCTLEMEGENRFKVKTECQQDCKEDTANLAGENFIEKHGSDSTNRQKANKSEAIEGELIAVPCSSKLSQQVKSLIKTAKTLKCWRCKRLFEMAEDLKKHKCSSKHFNLKNSGKCRYKHLCNPIEIAKLEMLSEQFSTGLNISKVCPTCNKTIPNEKFYRGSHLNTHVKTVPLPCRENDCKENFFNPSLRKYHEVHDHRTKNLKPKNTVKLNIKPKNTVKLKIKPKHTVKINKNRYNLCDIPCKWVKRESRETNSKLLSTEDQKQLLKLTTDSTSVLRPLSNGNKKQVYGIKCKICGLVISSRLNCGLHINTMHTHSVKFKCRGKDCTELFNSPFTRRLHESRQHYADRLHLCTQCGIGFPLRDSLKRHMRTHPGTLEHAKKIKDASQKPKPIYKCTFNGCKLEFKCSRTFEVHVSTHTGQPMKCDSCGKLCYGEKHLNWHQRTHLAKKIQHTCLVCLKTFWRKSSLSRHAKIHKEKSKRQQYACEICGNLFICKRSLKYHQDTMHNNKARAVVLCDECGASLDASSKSTHIYYCPARKTSVCDYCHRSLVPSKFQDHYRFHTGEKPFKCPTCSRKFTTETLLNKHKFLIHVRPKQTEKEPHKCKFCANGYSNKKDAKNHEKNCPIADNRKFHCEICDTYFGTRQTLKKHKPIHEKQPKPTDGQPPAKPYNICGKAGINRINPLERKYKCTFCGLGFKTYNTRATHERIHTNFRPYTCTHCKAGYRDRSTLLLHEAGHCPVLRNKVK